MAGIKKGAELRQKIIDTAWELFYENGYENTTVNDIIRKVGTSKGGFYYYLTYSHKFNIQVKTATSVIS